MHGTISRLVAEPAKVRGLCSFIDNKSTDIMNKVECAVQRQHVIIVVGLVASLVALRVWLNSGPSTTSENSGRLEDKSMAKQVVYPKVILYGDSITQVR